MVYTLCIPKYLIQDSLYMVFTLDEILYKWFIPYTCYITYTWYIPQTWCILFKWQNALYKILNIWYIT